MGWWTDGSATSSVEWSGINTNFLFGSDTNHKALGINNKGEVVGVQLGSSGQPNLGYYWSGLGGSGEWTSGSPTYFPMGGINNKSLTLGEDDTIGAYWQVGEGGVHATGKVNPLDLSSLVLGLNDNSSYLAGESGRKAFLFDVDKNQLFNMNNYLTPAIPFSELDQLKRH